METATDGKEGGISGTVKYLVGQFMTTILMLVVCILVFFIGHQTGVSNACTSTFENKAAQRECMNNTTFKGARDPELFVLMPNKPLTEGNN